MALSTVVRMIDIHRRNRSAVYFPLKCGMWKCEICRVKRAPRILDKFIGEMFSSTNKNH